MKKYIKTFLVFALMLINTIAFAFPEEAPKDGDPPAPIDDYILILIFLGIGFALWHQYKKAEKI